MFLSALAAGSMLLATPVSSAAEDYRIYSEVVSGKVEVAQPRCFRAPCPPLVWIVAADGTKTRIAGPLVDDLAAVEGRSFTVQGKPGNGEDGAIEGQAFAPGPWRDFVTATVEDKSSCMGGNGPCITRVMLNTGFENIEVADPAEAERLRAFDGATLTVRGKVSPPGYRGSSPPTIDLSSEVVHVKGTVEKLPHGMNGQTHTITFGDDRSLLVTTTRDLSGVEGTPAWLRGRLVEELISGQPMLKATWASTTVYDNTTDPALAPSPVAAGPAGANVGRDANTVPVTSASSAGSAAGAGGGQSR